MSSLFLSRVRWAAGLLGLLVVITAIAVALIHLRDLSRIQHIAGIWMGLADALNDGTLYPPLEDEGRYAGTRYMPVVFAILSALTRATGDILVSAKLTALLTTLLLLVGIALVIRRQTGRWTDALLSAGVLLALPEGFNALLTPHADALSAALAVWGLFIIDEEEPSWPRLSLAALLFALAFLTKFSAIAGPAAAGLWLLFRGKWGRGAFVEGLSAVLVLVGFGLIVWASDGRLLANFRALASGGMSGESIRIGPARLVLVLIRLTPFLLLWPIALWLLLPFVRRAAGTREASRLSIWEWYLLWTLGTTAIIFTSPGTEFNHLLELQSACLIVVARHLASDSSTTDTPSPPPAVRETGLRLLLAGVMVWGAFSLFTPTDASAITAAQLADALPARPHLLCEDSSVPLVLNQRPVVLDAFAFRLLAERRLIDDEELALRVRDREFHALVMLARIDRPDESLCPQFHFGPSVTEAMRANYRYSHAVGRYHVYLPSQPASSIPTKSPR